jgi:hypothetical protein
MGGRAHRGTSGGGALIRHLLVTNDFPPKHGGIQSYLWELWRRLPADDVTVLTTPHAGAAEWDAEQRYRVVRTSERVLLPRPRLGARLERLAAEVGAPARFLGRVDDAVMPGLYGCGDVFAMLCRNRWLGLEQEGFGIVFLEAAAAGVPQVAGASGGSAEAVADGETGIVVDDPTDVDAVTAALDRLLGDEGLRRRMGAAARARAVAEFNYDGLAARLQTALGSVEG